MGVSCVGAGFWAKSFGTYQQLVMQFMNPELTFEGMADGLKSDLAFRLRTLII